LRSHILDRTRLAAGERVTFLSGAIELLFEISEAGSHFDLELEHPTLRLGVVCDDTGLWIRHEDKNGAPSPHYLARDARPSRFRIFLDFGSIEVFADRGRWVGTKRIDGFAPVSSALLHAPAGSVQHATVWALKP
jgi:beta-fructofuranosidase